MCSEHAKLADIPVVDLAKEMALLDADDALKYAHTHPHAPTATMLHMQTLPPTCIHAQHNITLTLPSPSCRQLYWDDGVHYTPAGYDRMAEIIFEVLKPKL